MAWLHTYPYLVESVILLLLAALTLVVLPRHRGSLILSCLLCVPNVVLGHLHVPWFWNPRVTVCFIASPEDVVWITSVGITVWFLAILPWANGLHVEWRLGRLLVRYAGCQVAGLVLLGTALRAFPDPAEVMVPMLLTMLLMSAILAWVRADVLPLALLAAASYTVYHGLDVFAFTHLWPETQGYWNPAAQLPWTIFRIPAYELVWAFAFGLVWPLIMAFACDVRRSPQPGSSAQAPIS